MDVTGERPRGDAQPSAAEPPDGAPLPAPVVAPVTAPPPAGFLSQIPSEIFGLPLVAWIGIAIFLPIFFLIFSAYL